MPVMDGERLSYALAPLTSWHIGGPAQRFYNPPSLEKCAEYLRLLPENTALTWLGLGSNILVRDKGIEGAVICTRQLQELVQQEDLTIVAQAGVTCAKLARFSCKRDFKDAAFFAGIPGTVGGALAMNAGAWGGETWEWVQRVIVMNRQGQIFERTPSDYDIRYRTVIGRHPEQKQEAFMGAVFRFPAHPGVDGMTMIREFIHKRSQSQPIGTFNCGSVYRNPPGDYAARLIDACELKGYRVGDAMISPVHANFIINCDHASAKDVEMVMSTIESTVYSRFGIQLESEVKILGQEE